MNGWMGGSVNWSVIDGLVSQSINQLIAWLVDHLVVEWSINTHLDEVFQIYHFGGFYMWFHINWWLHRMEVAMTILRCPAMEIKKKFQFHMKTKLKLEMIAKMFQQIHVLFQNVCQIHKVPLEILWFGMNYSIFSM